MKIIISIFAVIGILAVLMFIALMIKNYKKIKETTNGEYKEFGNIIELIEFIRTIYECKIEHKVVMYGFVDSVFSDDVLLKNGLHDEQTLNVDVFLITRKGNEKVNSSCGNLQADLKKGDFVAVLPIYNERHKFWYYTTIAKLNTVYLGVGRGFSVKEQYVD